MEGWVLLPSKCLGPLLLAGEICRSVFTNDLKPWLLKVVSQWWSFVFSLLYLIILKHCFLCITPPFRTFRNPLPVVNPNLLMFRKLNSACPPLISLGWFIHSFNRCLLRTHLVPVVCLIPGSSIEPGRPGVCSHGVYFLERGKRL